MVTSLNLTGFKQHLDNILRHKLGLLGLFFAEPGAGLDDPCEFLARYAHYSMTQFIGYFFHQLDYLNSCIFW